MKFTLIVATIAVATGIKIQDKFAYDSNYQAKLESMNAEQKAYLDKYQGIRTLGIADQTNDDAFRKKFDASHYDY